MAPFMPVIEAMGVWGKRWIGGDLAEEDLDADLLMWDLRRRIDTAAARPGRTAVRFTLEDLPRKRRDYWIVIHPDREVDLCRRDPGYEVDLAVRTTLRTMVDIWMGRLPFVEAVGRREVSLHGPTELRRAFPTWLGLSLFARVETERGHAIPPPGPTRAHPPG